jgi:predicted metal-binding protein
MPKATLLICRSCHGAQQRPPDHASDGVELCERIQNLQQTLLGHNDLEVRGVNCLWTCGHPCSMALTAAGKPTYALAKVIIQDGNLEEVAEAALQLSKFYLDSKSGNIQWKHFPGILKSDFVARIPTSGENISDDEN